MVRKIIFAAYRALQFTFLKLIGMYRCCISPYLGNHCRFYPSCSQYAQDAISTHHIFKASYLIVRRLLRCHPFHRGGFDPVISTGDSCELSPHTHTHT